MTNHHQQRSGQYRALPGHASPNAIASTGWAGYMACLRVAAAYVTCALIWGTTWFAIRVCIGTDGYPTMAAAALRFSLAASVLLPLVAMGWARPGPRGRRQWIALLLAGVLNATGYSLVYMGEESISGGLASVLFATEPLAVALLVTLTRTERVSRGDLLGALVALVGVGLIFSDRLSVSTEQALGVALISSAVFVTGTYSLIVKREAANVNSLASATVFVSVSAVVLWGVSFARGWEPLPWPPPVNASLALLYLGLVGSVIAFVLFFYLLKRISLMTMSSLVFVIPVVALIVDAIWEDEATMVAHTWIGIMVTLGGVLLSVFLNRREARSLP